VEQGDHYWNSGIFTWRADTILEAFKKYAPDHDRLLGEIAAAIGTPQEKEIVERAYGHMPRISVDYAIMEHVEDVVTVEADFHWDDVGSWSAVGPHLPKDDNGNAVDGKFVGLDSENNVVLSHTGRVITTVGVEDMVIVDDGDVVFVCPKGRDQDVKKMVEYLRDHNMEHLL
jgi:mannose-1-phosphate guanylyltransferase